MAQDWNWIGDDNKALVAEVYGDKWGEDLEKLLKDRWGEDWAADPKGQDPDALGNLLRMQALPFAEEELQKEAESAFSKLEGELQNALGDVHFAADVSAEDLAKALTDAIKADPTATGEDPGKAAAAIKAALAKAEDEGKAELEAIIAEQQELLAAIGKLEEAIGGGV